MIDMVKRFFSKLGEGDAGQGAGTHDLRVAACALFLEMAKMDGAFSDTETKQIIHLLKEHYDLSDEHAAALMETSREQLKESIDLWQFTNLINENYTLEEKLEIIEMIWQVAYADGKLEAHEDYLAHKLAKLLRLNHKQLIDAKMKVLHGG